MESTQKQTDAFSALLNSPWTNPVIQDVSLFVSTTTQYGGVNSAAVDIVNAVSSKVDGFTSTVDVRSVLMPIGVCVVVYYTALDLISWTNNYYNHKQRNGQPVFLTMVPMANGLSKVLELYNSDTIPAGTLNPQIVRLEHNVDWANDMVGSINGSFTRNIWKYQDALNRYQTLSEKCSTQWTSYKNSLTAATNQIDGITGRGPEETQREYETRVKNTINSIVSTSIAPAYNQLVAASALLINDTSIKEDPLKNILSHSAALSAQITRENLWWQNVNATEQFSDHFMYGIISFAAGNALSLKGINTNVGNSDDTKDSYARSGNDTINAALAEK